MCGFPSFVVAVCTKTSMPFNPIFPENFLKFPHSKSPAEKSKFPLFPAQTLEVT